MRAFNLLATQIVHATGYFMIVEFQRLLLINLQDGKYQHLRAFAVSDNWQSEFNNIMLREALLNNSSQQVILVYALHKKNRNQ